MPWTISNASGHRWSGLEATTPLCERSVRRAEIVRHEGEADRVRMILGLPAESARQTGEASRRHPKLEVAALHDGC